MLFRSKDMEQARKEIQNEFNVARRDVSREVEQLKKELDGKIQRALDNPLAK